MMDKTDLQQFFLGANTGAGFASLYEEFARPETGAFLWYIKGGPGNGKSTLMRRAAERAESAGLAVEYLLCSGDPTSLDGIYIPEKKLGYVDATSPHVQEPPIPGASGKYLDLGGFYRAVPPEKRARLGGLYDAYRREYARSYDLLRAAMLVSPGGIPDLGIAEAEERVRAQALGFADKALKAGADNSEQRRFLSAYTCLGPVLLSGTAAQLGSVYTLDNELGLVDTFLRAVLEKARALGTRRIVCPDPLDPARLSALLLPECGVSLVAVSGDFRFDGAVRRRFRLDAVPLTEAQRREVRRAGALRRSLTAYAVEALQKAKALHDELETEYHPFVDFRALTRFEEKHLRKVFPE